jgi:hypothetical protein
VEIAYVYDRSIALQVNPTDAFIATSWWTAHVAHRAVNDLGREKFTFLEQEYEPIFYPTGTFYALAQQAHTFPQFAVFSTDFLRDYFRENKLGVFAAGDEQGEVNSTFFRNATNSFQITEKDLASVKRKRFLFYARPEPHAARNMFELGVLGLSEALREGHFDLDQWEFHGIGTVSNFRNLRLHRGATLKMLPRVSLQEYLNMLPSYALGLSLMLSPHPSMTPLDMAAAGLITVTNTYANKTREKWASISTNIVAIPPTQDGIKAGLVEALARVDNIQERVAGARVNWPLSWAEAFHDEFMLKLRRFIDATA